MWNRGKLVIVTIVGVAIIAAAFSTWYHYRGSHRALDFWGTSSAVLIAEAKNIELLELGPETEPGADEAETQPREGAQSREGEAKTGEEEADEAPEHPTSVEFDNRTWSVKSARDAPQAHGISNIRRALVLDTTFDWTSAPDNDVEPKWQYAMEFSDGRHWATVLFDFESGRAALTGAKKSARLDPAASKDFQEFFQEQFSAQPEAPAAQPEAPAAQPAAAADKPEEPAEPAAKAKPPEEAK